MVAFEDANFEETRKSHDCWNLADSFEHNAAMGHVFQPGADFPRATRHRDVLGAVAQSVRWDVLLLVCKSPCLLPNTNDNDINLLHSDMDKGK